MTIFRSQIFFSCDTFLKWSNVYHVSASTLAIASSSWLTALPFLVDLLHDTCLLERILTSSLTTGDFIQTVYNETGDDVSGGTLLPLYNAVKVLVQPANLGRPDVKFLKGFLTEDKHSQFELASGVATAVDVIFQNMIDAMTANTTPLTSENGDLWVSSSVQPAVQMRQLHRRRRRQT
jgi:hypothetical protein